MAALYQPQGEYDLYVRDESGQKVNSPVPQQQTRAAPITDQGNHGSCWSHAVASAWVGLFYRMPSMRRFCESLTPTELTLQIQRQLVQEQAALEGWCQACVDGIAKPRETVNCTRNDPSSGKKCCLKGNHISTAFEFLEKLFPDSGISLRTTRSRPTIADSMELSVITSFYVPEYWYKSFDNPCQPGECVFSSARIQRLEADLRTRLESMPASDRDSYKAAQKKIAGHACFIDTYDLEHDIFQVKNSYGDMKDGLVGRFFFDPTNLKDGDVWYHIFYYATPQDFPKVLDHKPLVSPWFRSCLDNKEIQAILLDEMTAQYSRGLYCVKDPSIVSPYHCIGYPIEDYIDVKLNRSMAVALEVASHPAAPSFLPFEQRALGWQPPEMDDEFSLTAIAAYRRACTLIKRTPPLFSEALQILHGRNGISIRSALSLLEGRYNKGIQFLSTGELTEVISRPTIRDTLQLPVIFVCETNLESAPELRAKCAYLVKGYNLEKDRFKLCRINRNGNEIDFELDPEWVRELEYVICFAKSKPFKPRKRPFTTQIANPRTHQSISIRACWLTESDTQRCLGWFPIPKQGPRSRYTHLGVSISEYIPFMLNRSQAAAERIESIQRIPCQVLKMIN